MVLSFFDGLVTYEIYLDKESGSTVYSQIQEQKEESLDEAIALSLGQIKEDELERAIALSLEEAKRTKNTSEPELIQYLLEEREEIARTMYAANEIIDEIIATESLIKASSNTKGYRLYEEKPINAGSQEFEFIRTLINKSLRKHNTGSGVVNGVDAEYFDIISAHRIHNSKLWRAYEYKKSEIISQYNGKLKEAPSSKYLAGKKMETCLICPQSNEYWLFHGAPGQTIKLLLEVGYDPRVSNVLGMFGGGFYLAENSSKSNQYIPCPGCQKNSVMQHGKCTCKDQDKITFAMIIYRACLGDVHIVTSYDEKIYKGTSTHPVRRPPIKPTSPEPYDSLLGECKQHGGDKLNFREIVLYDNNQAYPQYLVKYTRSLKSKPILDTKTLDTLSNQMAALFPLSLEI